MTRKEARIWLITKREEFMHKYMVKEAEALTMAIEALKADIVHCKECKHYDEGGFCWHPAAELGDTLATEPTDSCSYGERSEE